MTFEFIPGKLYRMPVVFGPTCGPRQVPEHVRIDDATTHRRTTITLTYGAPAERLERLLPPGFALRGQPRIVVELSFMYEIQWLAGRGYNILGARIPVTFSGEETVHGQFLTVLWESLTDPILSGRDELGFAKLYADIPEPRVFEGRREYTAGWGGFTFFDLSLEDIRAVSDPPPPDPQHQGTLHWKYVPATGGAGDADVSCITFTPAENPSLRVLGRSTARARARFRRASWEDLPTMFHIVNTLADLVDGAPSSCAIVESRGFKDLSDQRIVR